MEITEVKKLTPEMRRAQTRTYLLEAAAAVFAARGFHGATLDEIAEAAGFTKGAIYSHFESKEDLFLALVKERQGLMLEEFFGAYSEDPEAGMAAVTEAFTRLAPTPEEWALWGEFFLYSLRNPEVRQRLDADNRGMFQALVAFVEQHCKEIGVTPPFPVEVLARLYMAIFDGLARQRVFEPESVPDDMFTTMVQFVEDALKALGTPTS